MLSYPGRSVNNPLCLTQRPGQLYSFVLGSVPEEIITNPGHCVVTVVLLRKAHTLTVRRLTQEFKAMG